MLFELQRRERQGWTVLSVFGELDLSVVPRVRAALRELMPLPGASDPGPGSRPDLRVVIDLSEVDFLDSAGLGVVLGAVRRVRSAGGVAVVVVVPTTSPDHCFGVLGLGAVVPLAASLDDAVAGRTSVPVTAPSPVPDGTGSRPRGSVLVGEGRTADG